MTELIVFVLIPTDSFFHLWSLIVPVFNSISYLMVYILPDTIVFLREMSQEYKKNSSILNAISKENLDVFKEELPLNKMAKLEIKDYLSDSNIKTLIVKVSLLLSVLLVLLCFLFTPIARDKKTFDIIMIENKEYAVIYSDNEFVYLDEAEIEESTIRINIDNHRIENRAGVSFSSQSFDDVKRLSNTFKPKLENVGTTPAGQTVWRCRICGYEYVGEELPEDFICPICKHPASDFEKVEK